MSLRVIHGFNENRSFIYTQFYIITYKHYFKNYFISPDEARTRSLLPMQTHTHIYIYIYIYIYFLLKFFRLAVVRRLAYSNELESYGDEDLFLGSFKHITQV